jgi:large subunit ribosomal protein L25
MSEERLNIAAEPRTVVGKQVKQIRREGLIPAIIYGQKEAVKIQLENLSLRRILRHAGSTNLVDISLGKSKRTVLVREVQSHVTRGDLLHVDFIEVDMKVVITAEAELVIVGKSALTDDGLGVVTFRRCHLRRRSGCAGRCYNFDRPGDFRSSF